MQGAESEKFRPLAHFSPDPSLSSGPNRLFPSAFRKMRKTAPRHRSPFFFSLFPDFAERGGLTKTILYGIM